MKSKAIIIGNGFSSQLIPAYKDDTLKNKLQAITPQIVELLDQLWLDISFVFTKGIEYSSSPPLICREYYGMFDSEDTSFDPPYEVTINSLAVYAVPFAEKLRSYNVNSKKANDVFNRYISDPYSCLRYFVYNKKINAIEPYYSLGKMACDLKLITKNSLKELEKAIKFVFRNDGKYKFKFVEEKHCINQSITTHIPEDAKEIFAKNAELFLSKFKYIYTTNYDCLLEEFTDNEVRHVHGCFENIPYITHRIKRKGHEWTVAEDIIFGVTSIQKENRISSFGSSNIYKHYLNTIKSGLINEIYLFGYSGINDQHINECIIRNSSIEKIYYYGNPEEISNSFSEYEEHVKISLGLSLESTDKKLIIKPWSEVWDQLYP